MVEFRDKVCIIKKHYNVDDCFAELDSSLKQQSHLLAETVIILDTEFETLTNFVSLRLNDERYRLHNFLVDL